MRDAESAGLAGLFPVIILIFTSSTLVPIATMPGWLQAFAKVNPIIIVVDALRVLTLGGPHVQAIAPGRARSQPPLDVGGARGAVHVDHPRLQMNVFL